MDIEGRRSRAPQHEAERVPGRSCLRNGRIQAQANLDILDASRENIRYREGTERPP
jgi:hypothetical protein